jgi:hypothetical protein
MKPIRIPLAPVALAVLIGGCIGGAARPSSSITPASPSDAASPSPSPSRQPSSPAATTAGAQASLDATDRPPSAALMAEGGDPVDGQLGTYLWGSGGSDSPWLPGARIAVGAGEPLSVSVAADQPAVSWSARFVPANAVGPAGATAMGSGQGRPGFLAPDPGTWTVEVHLVFAAGEASYFWRLEVD